MFAPNVAWLQGTCEPCRQALFISSYSIKNNLVSVAEDTTVLALLGSTLVALAIDLTLNVLGSLPAGLLGNGDAVAKASVLDVLGGGVAAAEVALDEERDEEVGQGGEIEHVEPDGKGGAAGGDARGDLAAERVLDAANKTGGGVGGGRSAGSGGGSRDRLASHDGDGVVDERVDHRTGTTDEELGDLHRGKRALDEHWDADVESGDSVVGVLEYGQFSCSFSVMFWSEAYHHGVDEGVEEHEDPNRNRHVTHTSPHAHHGTSVVISLEGRAELALGEDDERVKDLVELAEVEQPAVESKTLVPHATGSITAGLSAGDHDAVSGEGLPGASGLVPEDSVTGTTFAVDLAHGVEKARDASRAQRADNSAAESVEHAPPGPCGVDGEEDVVGDHEPLEGKGLADAPGLLARGLVVGIEELGRDGIDGGDGERDLGVEDGLVDVVGDLEGRSKRGGAGRWWGNEAGVCWGRKLEEGPVGQAQGSGVEGDHCGRQLMCLVN